ncbi:uncharacterized protein B0T15DRAFT_533816 [Chaetomium strumarium]|uniref:Uncharacterized protein n=1 Tax=Chaetomium strumarium TaxID=1170767 RepID=A0AAJ0GTR9_9PEZI|nr:hypothetical protein B0T15DRAFT_533816 [Chaetomium strumarium]
MITTNSAPSTMDNNTAAETKALAEAMIRVVEPLSLTSIMDFTFNMVLGTGDVSDERKIMDYFVALLQPWLAAEGQTFVAVEARGQPNRLPGSVAMLKEKYKTTLQELEGLIQEFITDKAREQPNKDNNVVRTKLMTLLYCPLFCAVVDMRFEKAKAEIQGLDQKLRRMRIAGGEFLCCLFRCVDGKDLNRYLDRVMFYASEFMTALVEIRFIEGRDGVGDWWPLANRVEVHGCGLLWVLINLRFSREPCVAPRKHGYPENFTWRWGEEEHGKLLFHLSNQNITTVNIWFDIGPQHLEVLDDPPYVPESP